jgi:hypothetical protein
MSRNAQERAVREGLSTLDGTIYGLSQIKPGTLSADEASQIRERATQLRQVADRLDASRVADRTCPGCGQPMGGRADRRWCSSACRQRAYRRR